MAKIITVHGTNAGHPDDEGQRWWQRGSEFQKRLSAWISLDPPQFEPFHWGEGPNSELERRKAGDNLLKQIRANESAGQDYHLIGHSHGGSVIYHALLAASAKGIKLAHLRSWVTIGTPFLWTKPHWLLFRRLSHTGKVAFVYMIVGLASLIITVPLYYFYGRGITAATVKAMGQDVPPTDQIDLQLVGTMAMMPIVSALLLALIMWSQRRIRRHYSARTRNFFQQEYIPRWQPLWSQADEAINGLRATEPLRLTLFRRNIIIEPTKALFVLVLTFYSAFTFAVSIFFLFRYGFSPEYLIHSYPYVNSFTFGLVPAPDFADVQREPIDLLKVASFIAQHPFLLLAFLPVIGLSVLFLFLLLWFLLLFVHMVAFVVGIPTSAFLNRLTADRLRDAAFGNDTIGEQVVRVAPVPQDFDGKWAQLPDDIEKQLSAYCDRHAAIALKRVRDILGVSEQLAGKDDIAATIAKELTSHELIHVAYFEVEEFAKLIASALLDDGIVPRAEHTSSLSR
jgi:hypothetical protein